MTELYPKTSTSVAQEWTLAQISNCQVEEARFRFGLFSSLDCAGNPGLKEFTPLTEQIEMAAACVIAKIRRGRARCEGLGGLHLPSLRVY